MTPEEQLERLYTLAKDTGARARDGDELCEEAGVDPQVIRAAVRGIHTSEGPCDGKIVIALLAGIRFGKEL